MSDKISKSAAEYEYPAKKDKHCFRCIHFHQRSQSCSKVEGTIRNMGWCRLWERKLPRHERLRNILSEAPTDGRKSEGN